MIEEKWYPDLPEHIRNCCMDALIALIAPESTNYHQRTNDACAELCKIDLQSARAHLNEGAYEALNFLQACDFTPAGSTREEWTKKSTYLVRFILAYQRHLGALISRGELKEF